MKDHYTIPLALRDELIIDNFAGGGGASTGIEAAIGRPVDIAINHDPEALAMHAANHPHTAHYCESVWEIDPREVTKNQPVGLVWLSPDCKHFSKAKGGKPVEKKIRGLAWVALRWAAVTRPRVIILENVEEFKDWGPLIIDENGKARPCPKRKGRDFKSFTNALRRQGYTVDYRELRASDYGTPTIRKRLFLVARRDGLPIVWPKETTGNPNSLEVKSGKRKPWRTAAECIDFTLPCPSIFERKKPLAEATLRRIAKGIMRYVVNSQEPFIVTLTHHGADRVHPIDDPFRTVTGAHRGEMALVMPFLTEHANGSSPRNMPVEEPMRTQCAQVKGGHFALIGASLVQTGYGERKESWKCMSCGHVYDRSDLPTCGCVKCGSDDDPVLVKGQEPRAIDPSGPLGTIVAGGAKHALVSAFLAKHYGDRGQRPGSEFPEPLGTITSRDHHSIVAVHLSQHFGKSTGRSPGEPAGTVCTREKTSLVTSNLVKLRGTCRDGDSMPMATISAQGTHIAEVRAFLIKYYGTDQDPRLEEPLHTVTTKDRYGLVMVGGEEYAITDIGLRMLTPRELFLAQGFPANYIIGDDQEQGLHLTKTSQVRMCGNSVCPTVAQAIVEANFVHEKQIARMA